MDLQKPKKQTRANLNHQPLDQKTKKDLLRLERDIFALKKSQEKDSDYVIRKLMEKKQKPQMSMMMESPLLSRLKEFIPILHKSNQQLQQRPMEEVQKIDVRLEQCESSSSSESESDDEENNLLEQIDEQNKLSDEEEADEATNNQTNEVKNRSNGMNVQVKPQMLNIKNLKLKNHHYKDKSSSSAMDEESHFANNYKNNNSKFNTQPNTTNPNHNLVEINFLTYPYLNQQQIDRLQQNTPLQTNLIEEHVAQLRKKKQQKILIQEITSSKNNTQMQH